MADDSQHGETPHTAPHENPSAERPSSLGEGGGTKGRRRFRRRRRQSRVFERGLRDLIRACRTATTGSGIDDALSSSILTVMGSAPVFATAESMVAASQAQSQLLIGSVANQQRQNLIGMLATAGCVTQLLELGGRTIGGFDDVMDDLGDDIDTDD